MTYDLYAVAVLIATLVIFFLGWDQITGKPKENDEASPLPQIDDRRPPAAVLGMVEGERSHIRML